MRNVALLGFGFCLLVLQTAVATLVPLHGFAPNLMLPITIFLGVSQEVHIVRGALIAFALGYLLDAFCGSPMGLQTFVLVATFMVARGAGLRLFFRGPAFQVVLTFLMSLVAGGTVLALRAIFESVAPFPTREFGHNAVVLAQSALVTALAAPLLFVVVHRIEGWPLQRGAEGTTSR